MCSYIFLTIQPHYRLPIGVVIIIRGDFGFFIPQGLLLNNAIKLTFNPRCPRVYNFQAFKVLHTFLINSAPIGKYYNPFAGKLTWQLLALILC